MIISNLYERGLTLACGMRETYYKQIEGWAPAIKKILGQERHKARGRKCVMTKF